MTEEEIIAEMNGTERQDYIYWAAKLKGAQSTIEEARREMKKLRERIRRRVNAR